MPHRACSALLAIKLNLVNDSNNSSSAFSGNLRPAM